MHFVEYSSICQEFGFFGKKEGPKQCKGPLNPWGDLVTYQTHIAAVALHLNAYKVHACR